jgi:hypothetical protein
MAKAHTDDVDVALLDIASADDGQFPPASSHDLVCEV